MEIINHINLDKMVDRVLQWSNVNTGTFNVQGLERMASLLTQAFSNLECEKELLPLEPFEQVDREGRIQKRSLGPLLRFWKRPEAPVQVLLVGHMDTVYDAKHPFQNAMRKTDHIITGPGVTDMKGGICVMLESLTLFENLNHKENLGWEVIINPDEEIGSFSSSPFLMERAKYHQVGLLFEPALDEQGTLAGERKGSGKFTIIVHGIAAHAGRDFNKGKNAIVAAASLIQAIDKLNGQREGVTINVGRIEGGGALNVVPDISVIYLDVRIQEREDADFVHAHLREVVQKVATEKEIPIELKGGFHRKPKKMVGKTKALFEIVQTIAKDLGQNIHIKPSGGVCDGNNLAEAGLPNVDSLGVMGGKIHSPEEYLICDSLVERTLLTTAILSHLSEKGFG